MQKIELANIFDADVSPDGRLVMGITNSGVRIWRLADGALVLNVDCNSNVNACFSKNAQLVAIVGLRFIEIWNLVTGLRQSSFYADGSIYHVRFSPDCKSVIGCGDDRVLLVCTLNQASAKPKDLGLVEGHYFWARDAVFSPDGKQIVIVGSEGNKYSVGS